MNIREGSYKCRKVEEENESCDGGLEVPERIHNFI